MKIFWCLNFCGIIQSCQKKVEDFGMASSSYECQETGTYVGQTRCKFTNCDFYGKCTELICLIRYDGSIDGVENCHALTKSLPRKLQNRIRYHEENYDYDSVEGSGAYDCVDSMTDDEELDCLSRPPVLFPRDQISPPPKPSSFFNYENLILLIGALLGFIGSILLAFMIARSKNLLCYKPREERIRMERQKFLNNA